MRPRPAFLLCFALVALSACAKKEVTDFSGAASAAQPPAIGPAAALDVPQSAPPPVFEGRARSVVRLVQNTVADAAPVLEVRAWTRDGRMVPDLDFAVYWQTDDGPSLNSEKLGPEGRAFGPYPSGALIHRLYFRPTAFTAPALIQLGQFMQPGRILLVDVLILQAGVVTGVVLDETGAPVPNATLLGFQQAILNVDEAEEPPVDNMGSAGPDGSFRLGGFGPGPFVLEAASEGRVTVWRLAGVLAEAQELRGVELQMEPAHSVYGQVLNAEDAPVADARVVAGKAGRRALTRPGPIAEAVYVPGRQVVVRTNESGVFQLNGVPDTQEWNYNVEHPLHRKQLGRLDAGQLDLIVRLERGFEVRGIVRGADEVPVSGAAVMLLGGPRILSAVSNRKGEFVIGGLAEDSGRFLYVTQATHAPALIGPVDPGRNESLELRLSVRAPLAGTLTDANGTAVGGARVTLHWEGIPPGFPTEHYPAELLSLQSGLSSAAGAFAFDGIPAGTYRLEVTAEDGRRQTFPALRTGSEALALVLTVGK